jgi:hypothetical protein
MGRDKTFWKTLNPLLSGFLQGLAAAMIVWALLLFVLFVLVGCGGGVHAPLPKTTINEPLSCVVPRGLLHCEVKE